MKRNIIIFIILGISLWLFGINDPYVAGYGAANTLLGLAAKNYLRFGYLNLHFLPTYYVGPQLPMNPVFYLHHPFLQFILISIAYKLFGFHNWVGYSVAFVFSLGSLFFIFRLGKLIWNETIGLYAAAFASLMPMMIIFGVKQAGFEQGVLFFTLGSLYFFLRYVLAGNRLDLVKLSAFSFGAIMIDWGALYLIPALMVGNFLIPKNNKFLKSLKIYTLTVILGTAGFFLVLYLVFGNFNDFITQIRTRAFDRELFNLSYPIFRLAAISLLRSIIYFTPLVFILSLRYFLRLIYQIIKRDKLGIEDTTIIILFIFGAINIVLVPASTWQHIYFLFFLIPFFALTAAIALYKFKLKKISILLIFLITFSWSFFITYYKYRQLNKHVWKYSAAKEVSKKIEPYATVGVYGFPGDIFEFYFDHPSQPLQNYNQIADFLTEEKYPVVFSCWGECSIDDSEFLITLGESFLVKEIGFGNNKVWLIDPDRDLHIPNPLKRLEIKRQKEDDRVESIYRKIRNLFKVGQL